MTSEDDPAPNQQESSSSTAAPTRKRRLLADAPFVINLNPKDDDLFHAFKRKPPPKKLPPCSDAYVNIEAWEAFRRRGNPRLRQYINTSNTPKRPRNQWVRLGENPGDPALKFLSNDFFREPESTQNGHNHWVLSPSAHRRRKSGSPSHGVASPEKQSSKVGPHYQATVHRTLEDEDPTPTVVCDGTEGDVLWDPNRAAAGDIEEIDSIASTTTGFHTAMLFMEACHMSNYSKADAMKHFHQLRKDDPQTAVELTPSERVKFLSYCKGPLIGHEKDFRTCAANLGISVDAAMVNYYRWKAQSPADYLAGKAERHKEMDECVVCKDGGSLIVCEECYDCYHLRCLSPPLRRVPEGQWFCRTCRQTRPAVVKPSPPKKKVEKSPTLLRRLKASPMKENDPRFRLELPPPPCLEDVLKRNGETAHTTSPPDHGISESRRKLLMGFHRELFPSLPPATNSPPTPRIEYDPNLESSSDDDSLTPSPDKLSALSLDESPEKDEDSSYCSNGNGNGDEDDEFVFSTEQSGRRHAAKRPSSKQPSAAMSQVSSAFVNIRIPVPADGGLLINVSHGMKGVRTRFSGLFFNGYRRDAQNRLGYAEKCGLFAIGDEFVYINGVDCTNRSSHETLQVLIRMKASGKVLSLVVSRGNRHPAGPLPQAHPVSHACVLPSRSLRNAVATKPPPPQANPPTQTNRQVAGRTQNSPLRPPIPLPRALPVRPKDSKEASLLHQHDKNSTHSRKDESSYSAGTNARHKDYGQDSTAVGEPPTEPSKDPDQSPTDQADQQQPKQDSNRLVHLSIPVEKEGLLIRVTDMSKVTSTKQSALCFTGYRRGSQNQAGYAERMKLFKVGDKFVSINGVDCCNCSPQEALDVLQQKMKESEKVLSLVVARGDPLGEGTWQS